MERITGRVKMVRRGRGLSSSSLAGAATEEEVGVVVPDSGEGRRFFLIVYESWLW